MAVRLLTGSDGVEVQRTPDWNRGTTSALPAQATGGLAGLLLFESPSMVLSLEIKPDARRNARPPRRCGYYTPSYSICQGFSRPPCRGAGHAQDQRQRDEGGVLLQRGELAGKGTTTVRYTHANDGFGGLISQKRGATTNWYAFDGLGSTRQLTGSNETVTDTYSYDAFGNLLDSTGTTTNMYRFVGRQGCYADSASGLLLLAHRYYNPEVWRFVASDQGKEKWPSLVTGR